MTDRRAQVDALAAATQLAAEPPLNDTAPRPRWVALEGEARARRMNTEALRVWCLKHRVPIREENNRRAFVSPEAIDAAVEALPLAAPNARARLRSDRDQLDEDLDAAARRR